MNVLRLPQIVVSSTKVWPELQASHPSIVKLFALLVLPLSLLPPVMLYFAGTHYGDTIFQGFAERQWNQVALIFFLAEIITFAGMGWLIKELCSNNEVEINLHDAYLLAAISPVPLWLSSLSLLVPNLAFSVGVSVAALGVSWGIIYHGVFALCHMRDEIVAVAVVNAVMAAGALAWLLLTLIVVLPGVWPV